MFEIIPDGPLPITEVRIIRVQTGVVDPARSQLLAGAAITIAGVFVVKEFRIVRVGERLIVAMPSRQATRRCPTCGVKVIDAHRFCGRCGGFVPPTLETEPVSKVFIDIAHPIEQSCREQITNAILAAYHREIHEDVIPEVVAKKVGGPLATRLRSA